MTDAIEQNKQTVLAFYRYAIVEKDFAAARSLIGPGYIQHNPQIADGVDGLEAFLTYLRDSFPGLTMQVKRLVAEGDLVVGHVHGVRVPGTSGAAIIDIFRFEDGKIVEHWDVLQPVPDEAANSHTMF